MRLFTQCTFPFVIGFNILLLYMGYFTIFLSVYYGLWGFIGIYEYYFNIASKTLYIRDRDGNRYQQL